MSSKRLAIIAGTAILSLAPLPASWSLDADSLVPGVRTACAEGGGCCSELGSLCLKDGVLRLNYRPCPTQ